MLTREGLATISQHKAASDSRLMADLREFSRRFRESHGTSSGPTAPYWRYDPMDHGMRRWEYPFLAERVLAMGADAPLRMLDAGAGMTCVPWYFADRLPNATVDACDMDPPLPAMYDTINAKSKRGVRFTDADLRKLPYDDATFDLIFCMSVLEHTDEYDRIIREFRRALRPGGALIVTFDISLDGRTDIEVSRAEKLIESLATHFDGVPTDALIPLAERLKISELLTTDHLRKTSPELLPWHMTPRMFFGALRRFQLPKTPFFSITVCGLSLTRPAN
ncbi:MAG TPA: class I SAM-dependent methyltransferase [Phycisphaerae bacterium]|nr:class I SAM-dependent methyltransferase [Phycisphaerae bacterium]HRW55094.1 class I SAM-dependent methyltransferase [Phycisphaerae bacterium]